MTYAIGYVIYGVPFSETGYDSALSNLTSDGVTDEDFEIEHSSDEEWEKWQKDVSAILMKHAQTVYSGGGYCNPGWFGIQIGEFDETENFQLSSLEEESEVTQEQKNEVLESFRLLPKELQELFGGEEALDVYVVWGSS